ncbi:MAG TPA: cytochrome P460 family protein [Kofleriaceae bacterium]|jgi:cytochrome c553|nr:cytochrome P460 family protein [Kofleriaceae bacterium]
MHSIRIKSFVGALVISLGLPIVAYAGGDAAAGKIMSVACQACHVSDASTGDTPHLAGQRASYLVKQLKAFKAGDRKNPVMSAITSVLGDADIDNLAAFWSSQASGSDTTVPPQVAAIKKSRMSFPRDFPKGFVLYSSTNKDDQNTVTRQYINEVGFQAVKAGKPVPDGSVIMVVSYAAKLGPDKKPVADKDGSWQIDQPKAYEGMEARAGWGKDIPELIRNVNWNYAVFGADKAPKTEINQAICLTCHVPAAKTSYVFSLAKIQAKASAK